MITSEDYWRMIAPEIGNRDAEDCREWPFTIHFIGWLAGEILSLFEKPIKLVAILCLWWPVNLYG